MPIYALIGAACASLAELYFRLYYAAGWLACWPAIVLGVVVNYCIFRLLSSHSMVEAFVVFSLATCVGRLLVTWLAGDPLTVKHIVALGLIVAARLAVR